VGNVPVKLRILDNSIRLRLTRSEVATLCRNGLVTARTGFPDAHTLAYAVECSPASVAPAAFFSNNVITIRLPETTVLRWAGSEQVSIDGEQRLDDGSVLRVLVEKDFACLAPRADEEESDMFPHPGSEQC
jgi:hypothetical protein